MKAKDTENAVNFNLKYETFTIEKKKNPFTDIPDVANRTSYCDVKKFSIKFIGRAVCFCFRSEKSSMEKYVSQPTRYVICSIKYYRFRMTQY